MSLIYDAAYLLLLALATPWLSYQSWRTGKYREGGWQKLLGRVPRRNSPRPCIWFHAVSVGEVNLLVRLRQEWARRFPDWDVVVSSTTQTGFALAQDRFPNDLVCYCPLDFSWGVRTALSRLRPDLLVLAELELWPNLIRIAKRRGVPVAVVNGRLSEASFKGYRRVAPLVSSWLRRIDWIAAQTDTYAQRFRELGAAPERVSNTGSLKFDRVEFDRSNAKTSELSRLVGLSDTDVVWVVGSTQAPEEAMALRIFLRLQSRWPAMKLIIVPRHAERFDEVAQLVAQADVRSLRRSDLRVPAGQPLDWQVLVVDTIGELGAWWGTAQVAFVGGSMGSRGGQNMIEPAAYGAAVCFGPKTKNFRDVVQLLKAAAAAEEVADEDALQRFVERCLTEPETAQQMGARAQALVHAQQGATRRTMDGLSQLVAGHTNSPQRDLKRVA